MRQAIWTTSRCPSLRPRLPGTVPIQVSFWKIINNPIELDFRQYGLAAENGQTHRITLPQIRAGEYEGIADKVGGQRSMDKWAILSPG